MRYSSAQRRSAARRRIYEVLATTLEHDVDALGAAWVEELIEEGIPPETVRAEAARIIGLLRAKTVKRTYGAKP